MYDAVVVGAGPNGLAAAIALRQAGRSVAVFERAEEPGGGSRTAELTLPGFRHDLGAAVHALGAASPFFDSLPLEDHGLRWRRPEIPLAHPLDGGRAVALHHSLEVTGESLHADGRAYRHLVGGLVRRWDALEDAIFGPVLRIPQHPLELARFGVRGLVPVSRMAKRTFLSEEARALMAGLAAHVPMPLTKWANTSVALVLAALVHVTGWPLAAGGSQAVTDALTSVLRELGGEIETGRTIAQMGDLPPSRAFLFDTGPGALVDIAGDSLPARIRRSLKRYRHGPGGFKVDYALSGPVPWTAEVCRRAGTLHIGGTLEEIGAAERQVWEGRSPHRPFVIASQPTVADPSRAPAGHHILWAYCHVPNGSPTDMTEAIETQIERFAPGFRELILARAVTTPADLEAGNPNLVGGDIGGGRMDHLRLLFRPRISFDPYRVAAGIYLCSASTPPGPGVHGMCGFHAARSVLRHT